MDKMRERERKLIRPVVVGRKGRTYELSAYKSESGGNGEAGWTKEFFSANGVDSLELITSHSPWKIGVNLSIDVDRYGRQIVTGTFGYSKGDVVTGTFGGNSTVLIQALGQSEGILGTIWTQTGSNSDTQTLTIDDDSELVYTNLSLSLSAAFTGTDGGYSGPAYAILVHHTFTSTSSTTGDPPVVGGSYSVSDAVLLGNITH